MPSHVSVKTFFLKKTNPEIDLLSVIYNLRNFKVNENAPNEINPQYKN